MRNWLRSLLRSMGCVRGAKNQLARRGPSRRLELETLEDRWVPSTFSSIVSNFNGTAIPAGDTVWFNAALKISGLGNSPVTVEVTNQVISFSAGGTDYTVNVPDSDITFAPTTTSAALVFNAGQNAWVASLPSTFSGNAFLGAAELQVPAGLPGGINPVTWSGNFATDTPGVKINWQWGAAVYSNFSTDYSALNVKPLDSNKLTAYQNSDHAGTPEAFKNFVMGGARGGGGSNWTGSYSATGSITPQVENLTPATLSGFVTDTSGVPLAGATVTLTHTNSLGQTVTSSTTTDSNGFYQFTNLPPGTYAVTATPPPGYVSASDQVGTVNGVTDGALDGTSSLNQIGLTNGNVGINYNFQDTLFSGSGGGFGGS